MGNTSNATLVTDNENDTFTAYSSLSEDEKNKISAIEKDIDVSNTASLSQFGIKAQKEIADFSVTILAEVKAKDSGYVGNMLIDLSSKINEVEINPNKSTNMLSRVPIIGSLIKSDNKNLQRFDTVDSQIDKIANMLVKARVDLLSDVSLFDLMYKKNLQYLKELNYYILAGELKLNELNTKTIPAAQLKARETGDSMDVQIVKDVIQTTNRFEKKLYDMKLSRITAAQAAPQIRLIQNANTELADKIQSSILNTIPLWKNQIIILLGLERQKKGLQAQHYVTETTNNLLKQNAEILKAGSVKIARESEKGIIELETLKSVSANLIKAIEETQKIQVEGRTKRQDAEKELINIQHDFKDKICKLGANIVPVQIPDPKGEIWAKAGKF